MHELCWHYEEFGDLETDVPGVTIFWQRDAAARAGLSDLDMMCLSALSDGVALPSVSPAVARQISMIHENMRRRGQTPRSSFVMLPAVSDLPVDSARVHDSASEPSDLVTALRASHSPKPHSTSTPATVEQTVDSAAEIARLAAVHANLFRTR